MEAPDHAHHADAHDCTKSCRDQVGMNTDECNALIYEIVDHLTTGLLALGSLSIRSSLSQVGQAPRDLASRSIATALVALEEWRLTLRQEFTTPLEDGPLVTKPSGHVLMDHMVRLYSGPHPAGSVGPWQPGGMSGPTNSRSANDKRNSR